MFLLSWKKTGPDKNTNRISNTLGLWHIPVLDCFCQILDCLSEFLNVPAEEYQLENKVSMDQRHAVDTVLKMCQS